MHSRRHGYHPAFMVRALGSSFQHYAADPKKNNTVPGQFSEWFDGESLTNKGMRLSPWEPPRFLWAAIEGVCGLMVTTDAPRVNPIIPSHWTWVGLRRLRYHGICLSYFAVRQDNDRFSMYSTAPLNSDCDVAVFERDVTDEVLVFSDRAESIALASSDHAVLLVGNTEPDTVTVPVDVQRIVDASQRYKLEIYNSERRAWEGAVIRQPGTLGGLAFSIEAGGFRLMQLAKVR